MGKKTVKIRYSRFTPGLSNVKQGYLTWIDGKGAECRTQILVGCEMQFSKVCILKCFWAQMQGCEMQLTLNLLNH